jgi:hypothetical protein
MAATLQPALIGWSWHLKTEMYGYTENNQEYTRWASSNIFIIIAVIIICSTAV